MENNLLSGSTSPPSPQRTDSHLSHYSAAVGVFVLGTVISFIIFLFYQQQHQNHSWQQWGIPITGMVISALAACYFLILTHRHLRVEQSDRRKAEKALHASEKRLIKAIREAKAASEAKTEFLATISHELRTPLNAIIGFVQCLLMEMDGPINDQQRATMQKVEKSSFLLLNLINDLLDLAKIEAHKMELECAPHDIVDIIYSCVEEIRPMAEQKQLPFQLEITVPYLFIEIDNMRIRQVLLNLFSNAIKFTEEGTIEVALVNSPHHIEIHITDTGIGLSAEELSKIFRPFSQADSSITRKYGGTGLGLMISKRIIDLHGGKIMVKSKKGEGSTFTIILRKIQN